MLAPLETQVFIGNQVSRTRGDGIEFADIREWEPGDRRRRINWRASARRSELWVNEQHPDHGRHPLPRRSRTSAQACAAHST
jgi:uncharacterized protein (DUF58 family)